MNQYEQAIIDHKPKWLAEHAPICLYKKVSHAEGLGVYFAFGDTTVRVGLCNYETGYNIESRHMDDSTRLLMCRKLGKAAASLGDVLLAMALRDGRKAVDPACADAKFFSAEHPLDPKDPTAGTYSNLFLSAPLDHDNVVRVFADMRRRGMKPDTLIVPLELKEAAEHVTTTEQLPDGRTNWIAVTRAIKQIVVLSALSTDDPASKTTWYLAQCEDGTGLLLAEDPVIEVHADWIEGAESIKVTAQKPDELPEGHNGASILKWMGAGLGSAKHISRCEAAG